MVPTNTSDDGPRSAPEEILHDFRRAGTRLQQQLFFLVAYFFRNACLLLSSSDGSHGRSCVHRRCCFSGKRASSSSTSSSWCHAESRCRTLSGVRVRRNGLWDKLWERALGTDSGDGLEDRSSSGRTPGTDSRDGLQTRTQRLRGRAGDNVRDWAHGQARAA